MSALSRIRNNIGLVAVVIFVALAAFILTDFLSGITSIFNSPPPAAVIAGEELSTQEFERRVSEAMQQYQGTATNDQLNSQIRDNVWNQVVQEKVYEQEYEKIGLIITDEELIDMMAGNHIPPSVIQGFFGQDPANPDMAFIRRGLQSLRTTPGGMAALKNLEDFLLRSRPQERYTNMIRRSYVGSNKMAQQLYMDQNKKVDISYVNIPFSTIPDSTINVSDSEINAYISSHKARFEQKDEAFVNYVRFDVNPSPEDSAKAKKRISDRLKSFAGSQNDSLYTQGRVRIPYSNTFQEITNVPTNIRDNVLGTADKTVLGPFRDGGYYKLYKIVAKGEAEKFSSNIDHILITASGNTAADTAAARSKAAGIARQARQGADFAELARENSQDPSSKSSGGKLGWYNNSGRFGDEFNTAVEKANTGSILGPIKGPGGFHVVKINNKTKTTFNIAEIEEEITPSSATKKQVYLAANQFVKKAKDNGDISAAATEIGLRAQPSSGLSATNTSIPGLNGGRNVAVWALNNDVNDVSSVLKINQDEKYLVAQITRKYEEGTKSADDIGTRELVRREVRNEKKAQLIKDKLAGLVGQELSAIQTAYGTGANLASAPGISFTSPSIPGIGQEPIILGKAVSLAEGESSGIITGKNGVYLIKADKVTEPAAPDAASLAGLKSNGVQSGWSLLQNKIAPALTDIADVEDTRIAYDWLVQRQGSR